VLSQFTRRNIEKYFPHVDVGRVKIIPSGVDVDRFAPADDRAALRRKLGMDDGATYMLTVRKLVPRMGLENLLKAVALVKGRGASGAGDLRVVVCGSGPLMPVLESLAQRLGIAGDVTLAGHVQDETLVNYYQAADLFVLPTEALEGFGISTVEALSANLPVVGTPAGATPEILGRIDPRLLTRDMSPEAIADAVAAWLDWRREEKGTTRYRDEVLSRYSWDGVTDAIEAYYAEVLETFRGERHGR
jgi:glycosyltransferase involved in cell wall biosynthesis